MSWEHGIARAFAMTDATWARHANPLSVWTRVPMLAVLVLIGWSRDWIGAWALVLLAPALLWLWWNPRAFAPPRHFQAWASRAVLGERAWLNRRAVPLPAHHARAARALALVPLPFLLAALWGVAVLQAWPALLGTLGATLAKLWFCDRMAWLWQDMRALHHPYHAWEQPASMDSQAADL
jgi:hypothetical protein